MANVRKNAVFDTSSPNLVASKPWPGFVAYEPTSLTLTVGGNTYQVQPYNAVQSSTGGPNGLAVAIFDYTTPFGNPAGETPGTTPYGNHVSVGLIQDPFHDGAGFALARERPVWSSGATRRNGGHRAQTSRWWVLHRPADRRRLNFFGRAYCSGNANATSASPIGDCSRTLPPAAITTN
jgi:hypothetical protein